jgi:hypothetical protein
MALLDYIAGFGRALASSVDAKTKVTLVQLAGIAGLNPNLDPTQASGEADGEQSEKEPLFGPLPLVWRQLKSGTLKGKTAHADVLVIRTADGLVPVAWKDVRIWNAFPSGLAEGQVAFAGYGGGFYSLSLTAGNVGSAKGNIHVIYCPYDFDSDGVPSKAHAIVIDPTSGNESVSITHGSGYQISMMADQGILMTVAGDCWAHMKPGPPSQFTVQATQITLKGSVALGANPIAGVPLLPALASPPCPSLFLSPV